jgi:hypothetical protein
MRIWHKILHQAWEHEHREEKAASLRIEATKPCLPMNSWASSQAADSKACACCSEQQTLSLTWWLSLPDIDNRKFSLFKTREGLDLKMEAFES